MDINVAETINGKNFNRFSEEIIACSMCGNGTTMTSTGLCDRCWELDRQISSNLDMAGRLVNKYSQWKPIEEAPKDGTDLLGWRKDCGCFLIRWTSVDEFMTSDELEETELDDDAIFSNDWFCAGFISGSRLEGNEVPTHFMELPPDPLDT